MHYFRHLSASLVVYDLRFHIFLALKCKAGQLAIPVGQHRKFLYFLYSLTNLFKRIADLVACFVHRGGKTSELYGYGLDGLP